MLNSDDWEFYNNYEEYIKSLIMKKHFIISLALTLFMCVDTNNLPAMPQDNPSSFEIYLTIEEKNDEQTEDRSIFDYSAYYYPISSEIYVVALGVGDSLVTLSNSSGREVARAIIKAEEGVGWVRVPEEPGTYQLTINSNNYHSYGIITI